MSVRVSSAALLAITIAFSGCGQSLLDSPPQGSQSGRVFDWLDASSTAGERRKEQGDKDRTRELKHAEIYYGDGAVSRKVAENQDRQGRLVPAGVTSGPLGTGFGLRKEANDKGAPPGLTRTPDDGVNLNFENAEIKSVARAILGDLLRLNFSIDPDVSGSISLSTRRPIRREQLLTVLESALRWRGAVMVRDVEFVRIIPEKSALGMGGANVGRDAGRGGYGITALPLENISADALSKILDGFGTPSEAVRIDPERNLLIVRGTSVERQQMIDTALAFDVNWMRNQAVGIFPVRSTSPDAIINDLSKVVDPNVVRAQPIERLNAILAVSKSADAMRQASDWITRLDRRSDGGARVRVYRLKHADARRVAALVREMFGTGNSTQLTAESGIIAPRTDKVSARVAATTTAPPSAGLQPDARAVAPTAAGFDTTLPEAAGAEGRVRITADVANNAIVVHSAQKDAILIEQAIRELDRATVQVAIEATIAEVTLNNSLSNGVQFYLRGKWGAISQSQDVPPLSRVVPGLNLLLGNEISPKFVLDALRSITEVKILSSPSLVVVANQPAILQVGDQVPITTRSAQAVTDPLAPIVNSIDFRDTGVILRITPQVHADSMVGIDIEQEISAVKDANNGNETLTPTISQRRVKSTVSVADGQTLLLAGLISEQRSKGKSGVPGVIDIPVLGNILAGRNTNESTRTELIIFVKPQVVRNMVDARKVAEDLRRRLKGFERW